VPHLSQQNSVLGGVSGIRGALIFGLRTYQKIMRGINKASQYVSRVTMGEAWSSVMSIGSVTVSFQKWADSILQVAFPPKCKGAAEDLLKDSTASERPYCKHK